MRSKSATIYGTEYQAHTGDYIYLDGSGINNSKKLLPCYEDACDGWDGADFRIADPIFGESRGIAVNVHLTGRTIQFKHGIRVIRCRIEFVGDCEPSTYASGYFFVD